MIGAHVLNQETIENLVFIAGIMQLGILVASALVPFQLNWREELSGLRRLHRQMYWIYGGYVVLAIIAFGLMCLFNSHEMAKGSGLAKSISAYIAIFWGVRLVLQSQLDAKEFLVTWWLTVGYHLLTVLFAALTILFSMLTLGLL